MIPDDNGKERRYYAKIRLNKNSEIPDPVSTEVYYYRNDMTFDFIIRWKWYFIYRAALLQVKYPRGFVEFTHGGYEYILPEDEHKKKVYNLLVAAKRKRTEFENKIVKARQQWDELFPIEEHPYWVKVEEKLQYYEDRIVTLTNEYEELNNKQIKTT